MCLCGSCRGSLSLTGLQPSAPALYAGRAVEEARCFCEVPPPSHGPSHNIRRFLCATLFSLIVSPATFILLCLGTMKPPQLPKCSRITFNFGPLQWIRSLPPRPWMVTPVFWEVVWKLLICFCVPQLLCVPHQLWVFSWWVKKPTGRKLNVLLLCITQQSGLTITGLEKGRVLPPNLTGVKERPSKTEDHEAE